MAKEMVAKIKLQIPGGQATPAPPVGPALGQRGVNIGEFVRRFNDATKKENGMIIPVEIFVYKDKTFDFITKSPPAAVLLKRAAAVAQGAKEPGKEVVGKVTREQIREIVRIKRRDLNAGSEEAAMRIIMGTARNMGLTVED